MLSRITAIRLVGVAYILAFTIWFALEGRTALSYFPRYSFQANMISDLGVPYMHFGGTQRLDYSPIAWLMNTNFFVSACLYAFPQWLLLFATEGEKPVDRNLRTGRAILSLVFLVGLIMVGAVPGGPEEKKNGRIVEHQIGATLSILGGNLCSIVAGASPDQLKPVVTDLAYRIGCIFLGVLGIVSVIALITVTPESQAGTVERLAVYTIFAWELLTGVSLLVAVNSKDTAKLKTG
ncbi:hypothetical protein AMS68_006590 [Peltaster fructicola]|uniref:DUF998 domain-containing protein n=1 Tax=Peltaster fructicola TaxID=286661 RepID=A0A6H0Y225_9PEZI|nr:hypothetical protein AMS68_006590 [Peltaster fructicola]